MIFSQISGTPTEQVHAARGRIKDQVMVIQTSPRFCRGLFFWPSQATAAMPKNIDEYLAALSDEKRDVLEKLRRTIRTAAPRAEECISYQIPAFRQNGMLVKARIAENGG